MKCLNEDCKNEFISKTDRKKYCSNACKQKYFRKHGKKGEITPLRLEVIYNSIMEAIGKINYGVNPVLEAQKSNNLAPMALGSNEPKKIKIRRSYENYADLKKECQSPEEWAELSAEIEQADHIPQRLRNLLLNR